jgi:ribosomal protein S1
MKMKSVIAVLVATVFLLSLVSLGFARGEMGVKGTVTKIEGNKVTVEVDAGKEMTVDVKDVKDIKVGDKVKIKDGVVEKMTEKPEKSEKPAKPGY